MTESYAVLVRVQYIIKKLFSRANNNNTSNNTTNTDNTNNNTNNNNNNNNSNNNTTNNTNNNTNNNTDSKPNNAESSEQGLNEFMKNVVLFDVCSGKGYAATLLSFIFPTLKVS